MIVTHASSTAADALNQVFGIDALTEGFPVGVAKIAIANG